MARTCCRSLEYLTEVLFSKALTKVLLTGLEVPAGPFVRVNRPWSLSQL